VDKEGSLNKASIDCCLNLNQILRGRTAKEASSEGVEDGRVWVAFFGFLED
jgi:hypothetical protein